MQLNINSPAYYTSNYGIDNEIYRMCQGISRFMRNKNYSEKIDVIGLVPIIAPKELIENGEWKEEIRYDMKYKVVYVSKHIEFEKYIHSDINEKKELIIDNILKSIKVIRKKSKFDYDRFKNDLLEFLKVSES